ncbi:MAG: sulfatase-like hydrolase/transferase [Gammaproteobacteria bacterium]
MDRPNIILIMTDQQRADTIGALGAPWMRTPVLDRLAGEGAAYTECFVTSPVCVGARASLFTGKYPHGCQVFSNFQPWQPTWVRMLADRGYHCVNIGKMHINPYDAPGGFHQRFMMENKDRPLFLEERDRAIYDEWDKALHARKLVKPSRYNRHAADPEGYKKALGAFEWHLDADMHPDHFIGDMADWWIRDRKNRDPLFLQIGFPGPHPPYDPLPEELARYADVDIPVPEVGEAELRAQPRAQQQLRDNMIEFNFDSIAWRRGATREDLLRLRRHYAANVTMIDTKIGQILEALQARGLLENALVIFTSDHADALGDHGHIQKWTMYDTVVRVPLIFWSRNLGVNPGRRDELVQMFDVAPTILEAAGVDIPVDFEARSLWGSLSGRAGHAPREAVYAELARDHIQTGSEFILMRRDRRWKIVVYLDDAYGELYDLDADPGEVRNLWNDGSVRALRDDLATACLRWLAQGMLNANRRASRAPQQPMRV